MCNISFSDNSFLVFYMLLSGHCNAVIGLPCLNKGNDDDDLHLENEQVSSLRDSSGSDQLWPPPKVYQDQNLGFFF